MRIGEKKNLRMSLLQKQHSGIKAIILKTKTAGGREGGGLTVARLKSFGLTPNIIDCSKQNSQPVLLYNLYDI